MIIYEKQIEWHCIRLIKNLLFEISWKKDTKANKLSYEQFCVINE